MLQRYPKSAGSWEAVVQIAAAIGLLAMAGIYSTIVERAALPDIAARLEVMLLALKITGVALLLALAVTFLRRHMKDPPLVLLWGAILAVAAIAWACGCLIFLTAF